MSKCDFKHLWKAASVCTKDFNRTNIKIHAIVHVSIDVSFQISTCINGALTRTQHSSIFLCTKNLSETCIKKSCIKKASHSRTAKEQSPKPSLVRILWLYSAKK